VQSGDEHDNEAECNPQVDDDQLTVVRSQRGGQKLCANGFTYTKQTDNRTKTAPINGIRWRCTDRLHRCRGTAVTDMQIQTCHVLIEHNHPPNEPSTLYTVALSKMKERAACSRDKPSVIVSDAIKDLPDSARAEMPSTSVIKRTLRNQRTSRYPPQPQSLENLSVSGPWATTGDSAGLPFLFYDSLDSSSSDEPRILAFGSQKCLEVLCTSKVWFMDGNFAMAPKLFMQVRKTIIS
jgi:hypothetical protein